MAEYTPTTEKVREAYSGGRSGEYHAVTGPEFDRWLAAHDAEVRQEQADHDAIRINDLDTRLTTAERELAEVRAGVVAEEPEWEYGIKAEGDDEPYTDTSLDVDWLCEQVTPEPGDAIVRRRVAGPWVPVKQEGAEA